MPDTFSQRVARFAQKRELLPKAARVIVALSGGPDSCALLLCLTELAATGQFPRPVAVAHFHHGVRGEDADEDAAFCAALCARLKIPCVVGLGAVPTQSGSYQSAAARALRYEFLQEAAADFEADTLTTAHTADDQAETVLGRTLRGTGVDGLAGIPARRQISPALTVMRPLLSMRRAEIVAYCAAQGITPRHDPSNDKTRYERTRLRRLLPELAEVFNPQVYSALNRLAENAAIDSDFLTTLANDLWQAASIEETEGIVLRRGTLLAAHPALRRRVLLKAVWRAAGTAFEEAAVSGSVAQLEELLVNGGQATLPGKLQGVVSETVLTLTRNTSLAATPDTFSVPLPVPGEAEVPSLALTVEAAHSAMEVLPRERHALKVAIATSHTNLIVRNVERGERFAPLGMGGRTRLVRDILREAIVPVGQRDTYPVVASGSTGEILWIIGVAQSESTRVTEEMAHYLCLTAHFADNLPGTSVERSNF